MRNGKRIHEVKIIRDVDTDPDTSYLGEYSKTATSEYSIDRAHSLDCPINLGTYKEHDPEDHECEYLGNDAWSCGHLDNDECCNGGDMERGQYRYFNPSSNYEDETPENTRKYVRQDYERMERLNRGDWCYLYIYAEAEVIIDDVVQTIRSGGLCGTESDSDETHLKSIEQEELDALKSQLHAIGFSKRAITAAMREVTR